MKNAGAKFLRRDMYVVNDGNQNFMELINSPGASVEGRSGLCIMVGDVHDVANLDLEGSHIAVQGVPTIKFG